MNKKEIKVNVAYTIGSNLIKLITSFILTIVVPKYMGESQFGYWQLFLLYTTYMGYSYLGVADGIYLREGGNEYNQIDYREHTNRIVVLSIYELCLAILIVIVSCFVLDDSVKIYLVLWAAIDMVIYIPRQTMKFLLQATNRIKEYSVSICIFTLSNCVLICLLLLLDVNDVRYIVMAHALTELFSFLYTAYACKELWRIKRTNLKEGLRGCISDAKVGINVLIASAASTVSVGIIRNAIEKKWGIEKFGSISLALSISKLFLTFVNSISIVLFPILRKMEGKQRENLYIRMRSVLIIPFWMLMLLYYPVQKIMGVILPQYIEALTYVTYLIPMCLYECIMALLVNTYLKTLRKEKTLLVINLITVAISVIVAFISVEIINSIIAALISIVGIIMLRTIIGEFLTCKYLGINSSREIIIDMFMGVGFILIYLMFSGWRAMVVYFIALLIYCILNSELIKGGMSIIKGMLVRCKVKK